MNGTILSPSGHINRLSQLVKRLDTMGIEVPKDLLAEAKMTNTLRIAEDRNNASRQAALLKLRNAPISEFQKVLESTQDTWNITAQVDQKKLDEEVEIIRYQRLSGGLRAASHGLYKGLSEQMNEVIDNYGLNTHQLPLGLTDNYDFMRSTPEEMAAIQAFRNAAPELDLRWDAYRMIAIEMGLDLNIGDVDELSPGLDVAFTLGAVDDIYVAKSLEHSMRVAKQGLTSSQLIAPIAPYACFNLHGVKLDIKTPDEGRALREKVQTSEWGA